MNAVGLLGLCGLVVACPFGPMAAVSIGHAAEGSYQSSMKVMLGCVVADTLYCALAVLGIGVASRLGANLNAVAMTLSVSYLLSSIVWGAKERRIPRTHLLLLGLMSNLMQPKTVLMVSSFLATVDLPRDGLPVLEALPPFFIGELFCWCASVAVGAGIWRMRHVGYLLLVRARPPKSVG